MKAFPNVLIPKTRKVCGLDWPLNTPEYMPYLVIARFGHSPRYWEHKIGQYGVARDLGLPDPGECMVEGFRKLFTPQEFSINAWSESALISMTNNVETILAGAASCGKSWTTGAWGYIWWALAPQNTTVFCGSTSVKALRRRTFKPVVAIHNILKKRGLPGVYSRSLVAVVNEDDNRDGVTADDVSTGVLGLAFFGSSTPEDQASRIGGTHNSTTQGSPYSGQGSVVAILDELQALPGEAISRALLNMASGTDLYRVVGSGNFNTRTDMMGERGEPQYGWASVGIDDDHQWETARGGYLIRYDALKSPAVLDPDGERKYPFLPNRTHIKNQLNEVKGNTNDPKFLSMARAWPRSEEDIGIIFPRVLQSKYKVCEPVQWMHGAPENTYLAFDPAYTADGDKAAFAVLHTGVFSTGKYGIAIGDITYARIDAQKTERPVQYQLSDQHIKRLKDLGIPITHSCLDESATQLVGDVITMEYGAPGIVRMNYASRATDRPISAHNNKRARDEYANYITELWFRVVEFASFGQIRGMPDEASRQFATRQRQLERQPIRMESKKDYKARFGRSPDDADVVAMGVGLVLQVEGLIPGKSVGSPFGFEWDFGRRPVRTVDTEDVSFTGDVMDV